MSSQDNYQRRRAGFRAELGEMDECLMEEVEDDVGESCSDNESLPEHAGAARSHGERAVTCKGTLPATRAQTQATPAAEDVVGGSGRCKSRPVSAGAMSASLRAPWTHSESTCAGLHSGWSAPIHLSPAERPSSCELQQHPAASANLQGGSGKGVSTRVRESLVLTARF